MNDAVRLIAAISATAAWLALVIYTIWRWRPKREPAKAGAVLVAFASQTGAAYNLALATAETLRASGRDVALRSFATLTPAMLAQTQKALFLLATTGEGDPPDEATVFLKRIGTGSFDLSGLRYGLLALGDSHYRNFCAFGRAFDRLLGDLGAQSIVDRVEADRLDAGALRLWQQNLRLFGAASAIPDWEAPRYARWTLTEREILNPGDPGALMYRLSLAPQNGLPEWKSGDVAEIYPGAAADAFGPAPNLPHRDYSVSTIPQEGALGIVVRLFVDANGQRGLGSGWLCERAAIGQTIALRIRSNPRFHAPDDASPLILIGNGTGIAALRAHLKARPQGTRNWLIFGERDPQRDRPFGQALDEWTATRHLTRRHLVFSRGSAATRYVQHAVLAEAVSLADWIDQGAVIMVCGSTAMGAAIDTTLREILGPACVDALLAEARYRRDVY